MSEWDGNGWTQYQRLVLSELERLGEGQDKIEAQLAKVEVRIAILQVKSGIWGFLGGAMTVVIMILVEFIKK